MKHAISSLETAMKAALALEPECTDRKAANRCKQIAWDCLEALQILKTVLAERKAAAKSAKNPATSDPATP